jgi:flagellar motor component MotA
MRAFKGGRWKATDYRDLLTMLFGVLSTFKKSGATALEPHLDSPERASSSAFPRLLQRPQGLIEFICDYLRMMTVNFEDPHQLAAMEGDIEKHHHEEPARSTRCRSWPTACPPSASSPRFSASSRRWARSTSRPRSWAR